MGALAMNEMDYMFGGGSCALSGPARRFSLSDCVLSCLPRYEQSPATTSRTQQAGATVLAWPAQPLQSTATVYSPESILESGDWILTEASEADVPDVLAVVHAAYARNVAVGYAYAAASEPASAVYADLSTKQILLVRHAQTGEAVATLRIEYPEGAPYIYVTRVAVLPGWQSRGLARALLTVAEGAARAAGRSALRLDTARDYTSLVAYYRRFGFTSIHERQWPDRPYVSVVLEKTLSPEV